MEFLKGISPREYQKEIFESCSKENCLVVLPTGIGKTLIALMMTIDRLKKFPTEKVVFLAPTKPLAEQHLGYFRKHLPELFGDLQLFTGTVRPEQRKKIWQTADIIFSTPQCVANDLRKGFYDLKEVCLLIEDEAHRCIKNYDYNYVAQAYKEQAKNQRIIGLTASPGSEAGKIKEICKNLSIQNVELRTRESSDVRKYLQELEFKKVLVDFPEEFEDMRKTLTKIFSDYIEELKKRNVLFGPVTKTGLIELQKKISGTLSRGNKNYNYLLGASACAQAIKIQHALELLETQTLESFNKYMRSLFSQASKQQSRGVVKLVSKPEFNFVFMQSSELLSKKQEHPKMEKLIEIIEVEKAKNPNSKSIIFTQFRDTASAIQEKINKLPGTNARVFVGQATKESVKGLSQKEQKKIIEEFKEGKINILVATSIGEEGLDIPEVNTVIFYEPVPSAIRAIQRAGRTARLSKGKLIILITKKTRDESFFYVSRSRERKMKTAIENIKNDLKNGIINYKEEQKRLI
jgi:Fanconi anemia group M protein